MFVETDIEVWSQSSTYQEEPGEAEAIPFAFLNEEVEYLDLETLIQTVAERLTAEWNYNPEHDRYELTIEPATQSPEQICISTSLCESGFLQDRELIAYQCKIMDRAEVTNHQWEACLTQAADFLFARLYINPQQEVYLESRTLLNQELTFDLVATMVQEMIQGAPKLRSQLLAHA